MKLEEILICVDMSQMTEIIIAIHLHKEVKM